MATDAAGPLALAALIKSRIEADILDQFFGIRKALDVANQGAQREADHIPHTAEPHDG